MAPSRPPVVTVLWDLDTCLPSGISSRDAATVISTVATAHGSIKKFQAFYLSNSRSRANWPGHDQPLSYRQQSYLQGLQMKGVEPVECSFLGGDSVEKAMTIELFTDIIDGGFHAPPTIIILSQSESLEFAGGKLHLKNYKLLLFKSWDEVHNASNAAMETSITSPPFSSAGGREDRDVEQVASDPTLAMGHIDRSVVQKFHVLVEVLWENIEKGQDRISRADIGNFLVRRDANVYQDAGFAGKSAFKNYIGTAEDRGVIRSGGGGSEAWVELRTSNDGGCSTSAN